VLVWGPVPFLGEGVPTADLLNKVEAANGVAVLAHPSRKDAWQSFSLCWSKHLLGVEIWNRKTDGWAPSRSAPSLLAGTPLVQFVGLDFHDQRQFFPLAMEIEIAPPFTEDTVLEHLKTRRCRATAFGLRVSQTWYPTTLPFLRLAERCRRRLASTYRRIAIPAVGPARGELPLAAEPNRAAHSSTAPREVSRRLGS